jgi:hypothetical protein
MILAVVLPCSVAELRSLSDEESSIISYKCVVTAVTRRTRMMIMSLDSLIDDSHFQC